MIFVQSLGCVAFLMLYFALEAHTCPCQRKSDCEHPQTVPIYEDKKEVYVFSRGASNVQTWSWNTITALVVPEEFSVNNESHSSAMCVTHRNKRKFAITVSMNLSGEIDSVSNESKSWIDFVVSKQQSWYADIVVVNLMPYFKSDVNSTKKDHQEMAIILKRVGTKIKELSNYSAEINCIIPWKPPCSEEDDDHCDFSTLSTDGCEKYIINPDSFTDVAGVKCRAKATIPLAKLLYGISEYVSHHISYSSIILGIPWHGYDYLCTDIENDVCIIGKTNDCNVNRKMMSLADLMSDPRKLMDEAKYSAIYAAPFYTNKNGSHQIWFENKLSLLGKYRVAHEMDLKGVAVMYGDDLSTKMSPNALVNDEEVWSWLTHEIILSVSKEPIRADFHVADTVAAVAVSCLLVGTFLGTLFTCLALKKRVKKPRQPFARDGGANVDEFLDEDPTL
ncbi:di-N-acetylchitobiase [Biomphalaria glabrata]|nr:di-N-acetylchitobiase [Biomphalaria glabrata]